LLPVSFHTIPVHVNLRRSAHNMAGSEHMGLAMVPFAPPKHNFVNSHRPCFLSQGGAEMVLIELLTKAHGRLPGYNTNEALPQTDEACVRVDG
jgi:hypothetical protein